MPEFPQIAEDRKTLLKIRWKPMRDHIKVFEDGTLLVVFLDGTEIECKNEEE